MEPPHDIDRYIALAWQHGASDLLLLTSSAPKIRLDGEMRTLDGEPILTEASLREHLAQLLGPIKLEEFDRELEADFTMSWHGRVRVRGNAFHQRGLPAVSLRLIPDAIPSFADLGLPPAVQAMAALRQGLVLFTGPTGSGKSTSLAAMIDWINDNRSCHVLTIEDPIEYVHTSRASAICQREIGTDTKSFERALRSALREDPDVILVGEMRDPESIAITLTLAETGHLVLSTLHTNDAAQALDRIVDVFPSERQAQVRMQLAGALQAIVAQRLVPRTDAGLVAAFEVMLATTAVRNLVREGKTSQLRNLVTLGQAAGMQTMEMALNALVAAGVIGYEDALAHAVVPKDIVRPAPINGLHHNGGSPAPSRR